MEQVFFNVPISKLEPIVKNWFKEALNDLNDQKFSKTNPEEKYLTPDQASEMLQVSKVTLWNWKRTGILTAFKIGRQVRYKLSDIQKIAEGKEADHE